jgi:hypothetical protein
VRATSIEAEWSRLVRNAEALPLFYVPNLARRQPAGDSLPPAFAAVCDSEGRQLLPFLCRLARMAEEAQ